MRRFKSPIISIAVFASLLLLSFPRDLYAYIDPGTGSYILQLVLAALLGASYGIKMFWGNIKGFFSKRLFKKVDKPSDNE